MTIGFPSRFAAFLLFALARSPPAAQTLFYEPLNAEVEGTPGTLLRQVPMMGASDGASAYRVLYRSTSFEGRPVVAWAHPTSGVVSHCAPSLAIFFFQQVQGLRASGLPYR